MARYSLSDNFETPQVPVEKMPIEQKGRFSIEEPSQFKRKSEIALKNLSSGAINTLILAWEFMKNPFLSESKDPREKLQKSAELSKRIQEHFNLTPPEAESATERILASGMKGFGAGFLFGPTGALTGMTGAVAGEAAREIGAPEWMANTLDLITSFTTPTGFLRKGAQKAISKTPEAAKRLAVTESEQLPKVRGILEKDKKIITPVATKDGLENFNRKIGVAVEENAEKIMEESLLGKQLEKQGTIIGDLISDAYNQTKTLASKNPNKVNLFKLSDSIKRQADRIEKSAPSLSDPTQEVVKKLRKYEKDFSNKSMSAEQLTNQWAEINKDLNSLYAKAELTGAEELYRKSLEEVKGKLLKEATRKLKDKPLINSFKQQNKLYHEAQKFDKAKSLLDPVFENQFNPSKFKQLFSSDRKFSDLKKSLGNKNAHRLKDISKYYVQPIEQMKKQFRTKSSLFNLEDLIKGAIVKKVVGLPAAIAVEMTPYMYGKLLMSENTQKLWVQLMRSIKDGSVRAVEKYSEELQKDLEG